VKVFFLLKLHVVVIPLISTFWLVHLSPCGDGDVLWGSLHLETSASIPKTLVLLCANNANPSCQD